MEFIQEFLPRLQELGIVGYWLLMAITFGESFVLAGIFIPGTILLIVMGGLVPQNYYDFYDLVFFAVCGAILGNAVSYELGHFGRLQTERYPFIAKYIKTGKDFFKKHGGKSIILARFIGPIRSIVPFVAGVSDMHRGQFYVLNVLSAIIWSFSYIALGYVFGYAWKRAVVVSSTAVTSLVVLIGLVVLAMWLYRWYNKRTAAIIKS